MSDSEALKMPQDKQAPPRATTVEMVQSITKMESTASQIVTTTQLGGLKFKDNEIESSFGHYWSQRYGLPMKTSMFMILTLSIMIQCFYSSFVETMAQCILTCIVIK